MKDQEVKDFFNNIFQPKPEKSFRVVRYCTHDKRYITITEVSTPCQECLKELKAEYNK